MSLISFENNFIFVKVPKTGSTSFKVALEKSFKLLRAQGMEKLEKLPEWPSVPKKHNWSIEKKWPYDPAHIPLKKIQNLNLFEFFKFTFVRNPWDRLVSQYQWRYAKGERDVSKRDFKEWTKWRWEGWLNWLENPRKVIRGVPVLGHRDKAVVLTHAFNEIYDEKEKKILVDWIGRYENLREDLEILCEKLGIDKDIETNVVTIWSKEVEVEPGENLVELTSTDVIYQE